MWLAVRIHYTDIYLQYLIDWWSNRSDIQSMTTKNNELLKKLNEQGDINAHLKIVEDSLTATIKSLETEIKNLEYKVTLVDADIHPQGFSALNVTDDPPKFKIPSLFKAFAEKKITYSNKEDFFIKAFDKLIRDGKLVDISKRDWVTGEVGSPYVHPDLAKAIDNINDNEKDALKKMGFPNGLKISSAARTPYNQAVQLATQPVAAGLFSSGHLCGASVDFKNEDVIINNYPAFSKLMSKYGLFADPNLGPGTKNQDPKHVYLGSFKGPNASQGFVNDLLTSCLGAYQEAMTNERDLQNAKSNELSGENKILNGLIANMDTHLATVAEKLDKLKKQKAELDKAKEASEKKLADKTKERALREIKREMDNNGGRYNDRQMRERLGREDAPRDGNWERTREWSARGEGWECRGGSYENSRGDRKEWGECRTTPNERGGIDRLP